MQTEKELTKLNVTHIFLKLLKNSFCWICVTLDFSGLNRRACWCRWKKQRNTKENIANLYRNHSACMCMYHTWMFTTNYFPSDPIHPSNAKCIDITYRRRNVLSSVFWNAHMKEKEIWISDKNEFICVVSFSMYHCVVAATATVAAAKALGCEYNGIKCKLNMFSGQHTML